MIEYGKIVRTQEIDVFANSQGSPVVTYHQSIKVTGDGDVKAIYDTLMADYQAKHITNPGIQVEVYPDTGRIKRVVKSWTEMR